ncbi:MAG TPA: hypothetical protein VMM18_11610 [Gemmatimonadaceae bacterium]|nr:hypothetical protein [Gemmatimonadaceae bacterium]
MTNHIDVSSVLRGSVCEVYSDLVTRPTGAAVRTQIERQLAGISGRSLTVIDFSHVGLLDFSCADEVVAKLLLRYRDESPPHDLYFIFRGMSESHLDAIEAVLEHHGLALVIEVDDGATALLGKVDDGERRIWNALCQQRIGSTRALEELLGLPREEAERRIDRLCRLRLVMRLDDGYLAVGALV